MSEHLTHQQLVQGARVKVLDEEEEIDEGVIRSAITGRMIKLESRVFLPGKIIEFVFMDESWYMLFRDPNTGKKSHDPSSSTYTFEYA